MECKSVMNSCQRVLSAEAPPAPGISELAEATDLPGNMVGIRKNHDVSAPSAKQVPDHTSFEKWYVDTVREKNRVFERCLFDAFE